MYSEGKPLIIPLEGFHIPYVTPPLPPLKSIPGYDLSKKDQKWKRPLFPSDEEILNYSKEEKFEIIKTDLLRRINGYWFMNNGVPTYITGSMYFALTHWYMAAVNETGYAEYRKALRDWMYVIDLCDIDENCFGCIMMCQKRFGKTEVSLADEYNKASRGGVRKINGRFIDDTDCLFGLQSLTSTEAKNNLFKSRIMRSHKRIQNYLKPVSNESNSKKEIVGELTFMGENLGDGKYKYALNNVIDHRPTLASAYQGKRPRQIFLDEPGSIEEMDLMEWWTTVKQQLALGTKAFGKAYLPTTLESMTPRGAPIFKTLWEQSNPKKRDANGRTESGLYRYFKPQYLGREDFIDEYGNDLINEAKQFRQNELDNASPEGKRKIKRQYPETEAEAFDITFGGGLEAESIDVLSKRLEHLNKLEYVGQAYKIFEYDGTIEVQPITNNRNDEEEENIIIHEQPVANVQYEMGIDGTGTDKQTSETDSNKSKFSIVITKKFDANSKSYCDVAELVIRPERLDQCYKKALLLARHFNIHGGEKAVRRIMVRIWAEGNVGTAPAIVGYFYSCSALEFLQKQRKYFGTDNKEELNRYCFYRDATVRETQLFLTNRAAQLYGFNLNSRRLIRNLLLIGRTKTDIADAFQASILGWGAFHQPEKPKKPKAKPVPQLNFDQERGCWLITSEGEEDDEVYGEVDRGDT